MTREPGDLPSFVVTRESVGRGVPRRSISVDGRSWRRWQNETCRSDGPRCCEFLLMKSEFPKTAKGGICGAVRRSSPLLPCVLSAALSSPALGQEWLPEIEIGRPKSERQPVRDRRA